MNVKYVIRFNKIIYGYDLECMRPFKSYITEAQLVKNLGIVESLKLKKLSSEMWF